LQIGAAPGQEGAQNHDAAFFRQERGPGPAQLFENKSGQALEGKNLKARVAGQSGAAEELAFQLESGLPGGEENQGRPLGIPAQRGADFRQAPESFPGAGRTEEKSRLHAPLLAQNAGAGKEKQEDKLACHPRLAATERPLRRAILAIANSATKVGASEACPNL